MTTPVEPSQSAVQVRSVPAGHASRVSNGLDTQASNAGRSPGDSASVGEVWLVDAEVVFVGDPGRVHLIQGPSF